MEVLWGNFEAPLIFGKILYHKRPIAHVADLTVAYKDRPNGCAVKRIFGLI